MSDQPIPFIPIAPMRIVSFAPISVDPLCSVVNPGKTNPAPVIIADCCMNFFRFIKKKIFRFLESNKL